MHSMTGYGAAAGPVGRGRLYVEIKTVNHRYCEISLKLPPRMGALEGTLREYLQESLQRGRIECFLKELEPIFGPTELRLDTDLALAYQKALAQLQKVLKIKGIINPLQVTSLDHFVRPHEPEGNYLKVWHAMRRLVEKATRSTQQMRSKEGKNLGRDQKRRLTQLTAFLKRIEARFQINRKNYTRHHTASHNETNDTLDKMDITEELIRLKSHAKQYAQMLASSKPVGRKLDFLIQEMHREMNTLGAKACDVNISRDVVEAKSLLENLREQVQNIL